MRMVQVENDWQKGEYQYPSQTHISSRNVEDRLPFIHSMHIHPAGLSFCACISRDSLFLRKYVCWEEWGARKKPISIKNAQHKRKNKKWYELLECINCITEWMDCSVREPAKDDKKRLKIRASNKKIGPKNYYCFHFERTLVPSSYLNQGRSVWFDFHFCFTFFSS